MCTKFDLWEPGEFVDPHDAYFDCEGNIFVAEWFVTSRVNKRVKVGKYKKKLHITLIETERAQYRVRFRVSFVA